MGVLFEESSIAGMKLRNRFIRSATHEGMGDKEGRVLPDLTELYIKLAQGGVGAIITGYVAVQKNGRTLMNMRMFDNDDLIDDYKNMNLQLSHLGVPVIIQLVHGGGQTSKHVIGEQPVAPSERRYPIYSSIARELSENEIEEIIDNFTLAVERAKKAGYSGAQIQAAHGWLLHQFLSPHLNMRNDRWGGTVENRFRILSEIILRSRERVGNYPILVKYSASDGDKDGIRLDESMRIAEMLQRCGYDAIEVSCGGVDDRYNAVRVQKIPMDAIFALVPWFSSISKPKKVIMKILGTLLIKPRSPLNNYNVDAAAAIKKTVDIPIIVVGGFRRLKDMKNIISENKVDYISMSRPFIIEPGIVQKFKSGAQDESKCINCGYCLLGVTGSKLRCYYGKAKV